MRLKDIKNLHFTGIKGVGLTALALCAQDLGIKISGSDIREEFVTDEILKKRGLKWQTGFSKSHVPPATSHLIYTAAHQGFDNPEVREAQKRGIPTLSHAQALNLFMDGKTGIAVCGVGGKSTITAMIAHILDFAKAKPSFAVGVGNIPSLGAPGRYQQGKYFVTEADEYLNKFLTLQPQIIVATNISFDHPDVFANFSATKRAFAAFFDKLPNDGLLIASADNPETLSLARRSGRPLSTYGFSPQADWQIKNYHVSQQKAWFNLIYQQVEHEYHLSLPGKFNALNAAASVAVATHLGVDQRLCASALKTFASTKRRFEAIAPNIIDDYAHHPSEIQATLKAAHDWFRDKKIIAIFQPHTYSRTKALLNDFAQSFSSADEVIFLPIYASAREKADSEISSAILAEATSQHHPHAQFFADIPSLLQYLKSNHSDENLYLTLGAGDIFNLAQQLKRL